LFATTEIRQSSPDIVVQHADARGLFDGSNLAEDRLRLDRLSRNAVA